MCRDKKGNKIETTRQQPLPKKLLSIHNMIWFVRLCLSLCVNRLAAVWFHLGYYIHSTYNIVANVLQIRYTNKFLFCVVRVRNSAIIIQIDQSARSISCYHPKYQSLVLGFFYIIDVDSWKFGDKKFSYSNFMWSNEWWTNWMNWFFFSSYTFDFLRQRFSMSVMNTGIYEHWTYNGMHTHTHILFVETCNLYNKTNDNVVHWHVNRMRDQQWGEKKRTNCIGFFFISNEWRWFSQLSLLAYAHF